MPQSVLADVLRCLGKLCKAPGGDLTDAELLQRFLTDREERAFALLVQRHGPMVLRVCQRVLGNVDTAQDAFQATFLVLVQRAGSIRKRQSLASWLYGVAQRIAAKARAQSATRLKRERRPQEKMVDREPLDELTCQELRSVLDEEIARLPEKYRAPLVLCYFQDKSHDQAAQELGWPKRSLTSRVNRGRELLRRQLVRPGITLSAGALATVLTEQGKAASLGAILVIGTVKAALGVDAGVTAPQVAALARYAMRGSAMSVKILTAVLVVGLAVGSAGLVGLGAWTPGVAPDNAQAPVTDERSDASPSGADPYEEPLPRGALARLGTTRFRPGGTIYQMALAPDGRTAVTLAGIPGGKQMRFWDVNTGKTIRRIDEAQGGSGRLVSYAPHGKILASVDRYSTLHLWDSTTGKSLIQMQLKMGSVSSLGFSTDSTMVAAGGGESADKNTNSVIRVFRWDGSKLQRLWEAKPDHSDRGELSIASLAFSADGKRLATGDANLPLVASQAKAPLIRIWSVEDGKEIRQLKAAGIFRVGALAFAPIGNALASGSANGTLTLWDPAKGAKRWEKKRANQVTSLAFSADGKTLAVGGGPQLDWPEDKDAPFLALLDAASGAEIRSVPIVSDSVLSVAFSRDQKVLAAGLRSTLRFWSGAMVKERPLSAGHTASVCAIAMSDDGQTAATAGGDGLLILWDLAKRKEKLRWNAHTSAVTGIVFVPGGKLLASTGAADMVRMWDLANSQEIRTLQAKPVRERYSFNASLGSLAVSPDGKRLAAGDYYHRSVFVWDLSTAQLLHTLQQNDGVQSLAFSPDGKILAVGENTWHARNVLDPRKNFIVLWDAATGKKLREFPAHPSTATSLVFSPDGHALMSAGLDKTVDFWDVNSGAKLFDLPWEESIVAVYSPDGKTVAVGSACHSNASQGIGIWEIASKQLRHKFPGHGTYIHSLAFAPDGRTLVSGSMDTTALVWDIAGSGLDSKATAMLSPGQRDGLWKALASSDATEAARAISALTAQPKAAIPFLTDRMRDQPRADPARIRRLIANLDSDSFMVRQAAEKQLEALGKLAAPALRDTMARKGSLELSERIRRVLQKREIPVLAPDVLRVLRAIEVLEHLGTTEARHALKLFVESTLDDYCREEARSAKVRMERSVKSQPEQH